jgi:hypothetical protein
MSPTREGPGMRGDALSLVEQLDRFGAEVRFERAPGHPRARLRSWARWSTALRGGGGADPSPRR